MSNEGKKFEQDFINSVPSNWFKYRLNDSGGSWQGGDKARFTPSNICDFIVHNGKLFLLELKSHKGKSIPLTCIREKQLKGLIDATLKDEVAAGFILNFRDIEETYYISVLRLENIIHDNDRKSIALKDVKENGVLIPQEKKRTRYTYDLSFMEVS